MSKLQRLPIGTSSFPVRQKVKLIRDQNSGIAYRASKMQKPWDSMSSIFRRFIRSGSRPEKEETILLNASPGIKYAENPSKKYEDVYPLNFHNPDWRSLWEEMKDVVLFWVQHQVRIAIRFR